MPTDWTIAPDPTGPTWRDLILTLLACLFAGALIAGAGLLLAAA